MTFKKLTFRMVALTFLVGSLMNAQSVSAAVAKKPIVKAKAKAAVCARCVSKAEGADKTAAARANQWTGTIIGVNFGEQSVVITEGNALDHIKVFAQRSIKIKPGTELYKDDEQITFEGLDVGQRITAAGTYDAAKRIVTANRVDVGKRVAAAPVQKQENASAVAIEKSRVVEKVAAASKKTTVASKKIAVSGNSTVDLQKVLIAKGYLSVPKGTKLGNFGEQTKTALQKYQKSVGLPQTGTLGPKTRAKLGL